MTGEPHSPRAEALVAMSLPVSRVRYVEGARSEALERLGIRTIGDLVEHYPFRYIDLTTVLPLSDVRIGQDVTVAGIVRQVTVKRPRPKLHIVEVALSDESGGVLLGVWFNQPYMGKRFVEGERVALAGTVLFDYGMLQIRNPFVERLGVGAEGIALARILPVHRVTEGLTTQWMRRLISAALDEFGCLPDHLPVALRIERGLTSRAEALRSIHFPQDADSLEQARTRLVYDELLCLQIGMAVRRHRLTVDSPGISHRIDGPAMETLASALPVTLTADQSQAVDEVLADMAQSSPMNRMLLGDVGTGKTYVAAHALVACADTATQAAMMAPTEVLAQQYADKLGPLLEDVGVRWELLTGSTPASRRRQILDEVACGECTVLFGTHALLEASVRFANLSLAIVDEQHRFGVGQRLGLRGKGRGVDLLVMTATPIPRTLALTLYGDLAVSYLRARPGAHGPGHVTTRLVPHSRREDAYAEVRQAAKNGRQTYVVCPLVDESDELQVRSAVREARRLERDVFRDLRVGLITGKMRPSEKLDAMNRFREGDIDVLVSTTVIEVGVDVPNATIMIVEDAERFGLAQLHQLRGRIGRGEHPGTFMLFADPKTDEGRERMAAIESTDDGFALAELDMELRGQGDLFGSRQSGLPQFKLASLADDVRILEQTRDDAARIVHADPTLSDPRNALLAREVRVRFGEAWKWVSSG